MKSTSLLLIAIVLGFIAGTACPANAQGTAPVSAELYPLTPEFDVSTLKLQKTTVSIVPVDGKTKLKIEFTAAPNTFPNVQFPCPVGGWDLSAYSGIQVDITNTSPAPFYIVLRADSAGDPKSTPPPWNTNGATIPPGEAKTIQVTFGKSWGQPAFQLNPKAVTSIQIFTKDPPPESSVVISDLKAF